MSCVCAPGLSSEMALWVDLGGLNWGCCPDANHTRGFHMPASAIPPTDYSRRHEPGLPYNMDWACAIDAAHRKTPTLMVYHAQLLAKLMADDPSVSVVCEFIGKPWVDKPVYYWARWNGIATLQKYTGAGHDTWSHISVWRSRANERPALWTPRTPVPPSPIYPPWPGRFIQYRIGWTSRQRYRGADVHQWQQKMRERRWRITVDGDFGPASSRILKAFQQEKGLRVDGILGPRSWAATWNLPIT